MKMQEKKFRKKKKKFRKEMIFLNIMSLFNMHEKSTY